MEISCELPLLINIPTKHDINIKQKPYCVLFHTLKSQTVKPKLENPVISMKK